MKSSRNTRQKVAEKYNLEIIGDAVGNYVNKHAHKHYRLSCGHFQDMKCSHVAVGRFRCRSCVIDKHENTAKMYGLEIIDHNPTNDADYKLYRILSCNHTKLIATYNVDTFECDVCIDEKRYVAASRNNLTLLNGADSSVWNRRNYKYNSCGHIGSLRILDVENGCIAPCYTCREIRWKEEAASEGLELLGQTTEEKQTLEQGTYYDYKLPCGCVKNLQVGNVRCGVWACDTHSNWWNKSSNVYLIHFKTEGFEWLKLGVSRDVVKRITQYNLLASCEHKLLKVVPFTNFKGAIDFEKSLHKKYKSVNLNHELMKQYKGNGWSECYPMSLAETLIEELG